MIKPLQRMVGPYSKPIKVTPLSQMIPHRVSDDYSTGKAFNGIVPFSPDMLRLMEIEGDSYIVPKKQIHNLVNASDIDDWSHLFKKLNLLLGNMMKLLSNIRKQEYYKITYLKLEEKEIQRRHNLIKEKLLDRSTEQEEVEAKTPMTDREKIEQLKKSLAAMGFIAGGAMASLITEDLSGLQTGSVHKKGASIAKMLMSRYGLTDVQAAAIVGNFIRESGLTPYNVENSSPYDAQEPLPPPWGTPRTGYGWAQWTGGRLNVFLEKFLGGGPNKRGKAANDGDNWRMLTYELDGPYNHVIQGLKSYTDVTQATIYAEENYEGALIKANDERINAAKGVLKELREMKAAGGIVIPELFDRHRIQYDTERKSTLLSNFIVDKPTIIDTKDVGEPLIIIPLGRPIGVSILKILFEKPFKIIEKSYGQYQEKEKSEVNPQTPIQNSQTQTNRTSIPQSTTEIGTTSPPSYSASTESKNSIVSIPKEILSSETSSPIDPNIIGKITSNISPILEKTMQQKTRIDNVSQSVSDIFETEVFLLTQDITIIEE